MLSGMSQTCYVRYPDDEKDSPDTAGVPNPVVEISAHKLDSYRADGYVQCAADGSATDVQERGAGSSDADAPKLATVADDPVAEEIQAEAAGDEPAAPAKAETKPDPKTDKADKATTSGGNS